jgi:putative transposase
MVAVIDEYTRECLAIRVGRRLTAEDVQECLPELFCSRGVPGHIHSDIGQEFASRKIRRWLGKLGTRTLFIEPGSPWQNGRIESYNGKLRDEPLNREIFYTLQEAEVLIERRRQEYNQTRPHSWPGNRPPAPEVSPAAFLGSPLPTAAAFGLALTLVHKPGADQYRPARSTSSAMGIRFGPRGLLAARSHHRSSPVAVRGC